MPLLYHVTENFGVEISFGVVRFRDLSHYFSLIPLTMSYSASHHPSPSGKAELKSQNMDGSFFLPKTFPCLAKLSYVEATYMRPRKRWATSLPASGAIFIYSLSFSAVLCLPPNKMLTHYVKSRNKQMNETWYLSSGKSQTISTDNYR